jgi:hypothetical protein
MAEEDPAAARRHAMTDSDQANAPATARYRSEKRHNNWKTGPGRLGRALIHELMLVRKLGQRGLADKFFYLWPGCQAHFDHPLTPNMLYGRWWTGVGRGYENEHPDKNPETRRYLPYAKEPFHTHSVLARSSREVGREGVTPPAGRPARFLFI